MLFQWILSNRKGGVNKTCGGHTGDCFSSQEQAGVPGGAGTQLSVVGAARQPSPALLCLPDLRLQCCSLSLPFSPLCARVENRMVPFASLQPPALMSTITGFLKFQSCFL